MKNSVIMRVLCNSLYIDAGDMTEIISLEGYTLEAERAEALLKPVTEEDAEHVPCDMELLESFLNGYITYRRGAPESKDGIVEKRSLVMTSARNINNTILKKLKIALSLTNEDIIDILNEADVHVTKGDLTPLFRKEGHKHYKRCTDQLLMAFIDGIALMARG